MCYFLLQCICPPCSKMYKALGTMSMSLAFCGVGCYVHYPPLLASLLIYSDPEYLINIIYMDMLDICL